MKIKEGFMLRKVADNNVVVAVGKAMLDFNGLITLNESGTYLWSLLEKGVTSEEMVAKMCERYDVDKETADADVEEFVKNLEGAGIIEQ